MKAGRSIEEIARRTKIPAPTLERLESGDSTGVPADVFVCGFLRSYARELGLDGEEAVARYRRTSKNLEPGFVHAATAVPGEDEVAPLATVGVVESEPIGSRVDAFIGGLTARIPLLEDALGRRPTFALVVLLVVVVATITLSLLLGGDPRPGRGLS